MKTTQEGFGLLAANLRTRQYVQFGMLESFGTIGFRDKKLWDPILKFLFIMSNIIIAF